MPLAEALRVQDDHERTEDRRAHGDDRSARKIDATGDDDDGAAQGKEAQEHGLTQHHFGRVTWRVPVSVIGV